MILAVYMMSILFQHPYTAYAETYNWPVDTKYDITCGFYGYTNHNGVDFAVPLGTPVYASVGGKATVVDRGCLGSHRSDGAPKCSKGASCAAWNNIGPNGSYGNFIKITQSDGVVSYYCHLRTGIPIANGSTVQQGQLIGYSGCAGNATGPHLHFEMRKNGTILNPENYLKKSGTSASDTCNCSTSYAGTYKVSTSGYTLTIRTGHGTSYGVAGSIPDGATVTISKGNGSWAHVSYNGISGYCSMEYLTKVQTDTEAPVVSNVESEVANLSSLGYIVHCNVSDNVGVTRIEFHVAYGDEGQWKQYSGNIGDNYAWAYIPISDFGYRLGTYWTHIYAYDADGNFDRNVSLGPVYINGAALATQEKETVKEGTYCLKNANGSWMDVNGAEDKNGAEVVIPNVFNGGGNQQFRIEYIGNGKYHLIAAFASGSRVLDINRGSNYSDPLQSGCKVDIWQQNDAEAQEFYLTPWGDGSYAIELASKDNYVIGGRHVAVGVGYYLQQAVKESPSQHWYFCNSSGNVVDVTPETKCTGVSLNYSDSALLVGTTLQLTATVSPSNASNKTLEWSSSNTGVATVNASGLVTAVGVGTATITAKAQDGSNVSASCQITAAEKPSYTSIATDKTVYKLSDTVTITANASNVASSGVGIDEKSTGKRVVTEKFSGTTYSIAASRLGVGKYSAYFTLWNNINIGYTDTARVEFTIECDTHSYKEEVTKKPTCTEAGVKTFTCTVCGASKTESIPATGHQHTEIRNAKPSTAEQDGYTGDTYCKDCNTKLSSGTVIKKLSVTGRTSLSEVVSGNSITITAAASGGKEGYTYSFLIHNLDTDKWFRVSEFGKSNQYIWTANGTGQREFFAEVKDSAGTVVRSKAIKVTVKAKSLPLSISGKINTSEVISGKPVTISANATGGTGSYTYSFLIHNLENDTWYRWAFDKSAEHVWTASGSGSREFFAEVKDAAGTVVRSSAMKVTVKSAATPLAINGKASATQVTAGNTVTISASASGGTGNYTYSFIIHNLENDTWYRWAFDKSAEHVWTSSGSGSREFFAEVKDATGTVVRSTAMKVNVGNSTGTLQLLALADKTQATVGTAITINASAVGGTGNYTYSFLVHNLANDSWYRFGDFAKESSYIWTAGSSGTREFFVEVKDSNGTVVRSSAVVVTVK